MDKVCPPTTHTSSTPWIVPNDHTTACLAGELEGSVYTSSCWHCERSVEYPLHERGRTRWSPPINATTKLEGQRASSDLSSAPLDDGIDVGVARHAVAIRYRPTDSATLLRSFPPARGAASHYCHRQTNTRTTGCAGEERTSPRLLMLLRA